MNEAIKIIKNEIYDLSVKISLGNYSSEYIEELKIKKDQSIIILQQLNQYKELHK